MASNHQTKFRRSLQNNNRTTLRNNGQRIASNNTRIRRGHDRQNGEFRLSLKEVESLKLKEPEQIVLHLLDSKFGLENYLNVDRMGEKLIHDFTFVLVKSFECNAMPTKLRDLSIKIVESNFFKIILYNSVNEKINFDYNINLIKLVIKLLIELLYTNEYNFSSIAAMKDRLELIVLYRIQNEELKKEFNEFLNYEKEVLEKISKRQNKTFQNIQNDNVEPDDDFTTMSIVPSLNDIMNNQEIFLRKNITNGSYNNVHHYLDVQFRLLREDFMRPLREGISEFKEIIQKHKKGSMLNKEIINRIKKIQNLNTYFDVCCVSVETEREGIVYVMMLDKEKVKLINWETSKRLIYGSLICFSSDYFLNECLIGIVCERDEKELRKNGCFNVKFDFEESDQISYPEFGKAYIMLETSAFFESYKHVLKALKTFKREGEENFPFKENLVYCQNSVMPIPKYLKEASVDFNSLIKKFRRYIPSNTYLNPAKCFVSNPAGWPSAEQMNLDESQFEAIKLALTNKLALIQGPPGTGKTFLGVKIMKFLLDNKHSWWNRPLEKHKPILMICYTNHALDQFLEYCINECNLTSGVVRIGGRSKSENLEPFLLKNLKQNLKRGRQIEKTIHYAIINQFNIISKLKEKIKYISTKLDLIFRCHAILSINELSNHISSYHFDQLIKFSKFGYLNSNFSLIEWLGLIDLENYDLTEDFENLELSDEEHGQIVTGLNPDQDPEDESTIINQKIEETKPIESDLIIEEDHITNERMLDENFDEFKEIKKFNFDSELIKKEQLFEMVKLCKKKMGQYNEGGWKISNGKKIEDPEKVKFENDLEKIFFNASKQYTETDFELIENCSNIWRLDYNERFALYFRWIENYGKKQEVMIKILNNQYNNEVAKLKELRMQEDRSIMEDAYIIAMTTTGSSRYHSVLKDIGPRIIIVEEAAEVFEAHIVSALSKHCEHLILIGDHVQLRPNPAVYTLATQYHLDVSLFERLINNNTKRVMLNNQHRMRPEISILMKHFYEEKIFNDHSVNLYPSIKGLKKNIFFINHDHGEKRSADNTTKTNTYEAEYLAKLSLYLVKQGYDESKITVLTMYLGQFSEIKKRLRDLRLNSIKVSTVDNFQGEENEIILLSLVRSNIDGKIGFLNIKNRVCVALSRAKHGLFVIGNFEFIAQSEKRDTWKNLILTIKSNGYYGRCLNLTCGSHPENDIDVEEPNDFNKRPDGGCLVPCNFRLKCGHVCALKCHGNYDQEHALYKCQRNCDKKIERCGHLCKQICFTEHECKKCNVPIDKEIKECGHMVKIRCDTEPSRKYCQLPCEKILSCGHRCTKKCNEINCGNCLTKINVRSPCVHKSTLIVYCYEPKYTYLSKCKEPCGEILDCGHKCGGTCGSCFNGLIHKNCTEKCDRMLFCGHKCSVPCSKQCEPCKKQCPNECVHSKCSKICSEPCVDCLEKCQNCIHSECTKLCHELCDRKPCDEPCDKKLKCGHPCIGLCGEICPPWCRICHKNKVCQIFFGNEDDPDARFIFLKYCRHLIEVSAMDYWIESRYSDENNNSSNSIQLPECPKCKTPIKKIKRYSNVIKSQLKAINEIKLKHFGDMVENTKIFKQLNEQISAYKFDFNSKKDRFIAANMKKLLRDDLSFNSLAAIKNTWNIYLRLKKIKKIIDNNDSNDKRLFFKFEINKIFEALKSNQYELMMLKDGQKLRDISFELERVSSIVELERMRKLSTKIPNLTQNAVKIMFDLEEKLVNNPIRYDKISDEIGQMFNQLAPLLRTELTKEEKLMIVSAIGLSQGHWYKCPNGHVYCIGECGGAMQKSICPDCKAEIGGQNHQVVRGNQLASEMDGATRPAWPTGLDYF